MARTRHANFTTEQAKAGHKAIWLVELPDWGYYVASRTGVTLTVDGDSHAYDDAHLALNGIPSIRYQGVTGLAGFAPASNCTIEITNPEKASDLFNTYTRLTDPVVRVLLLFDDGSLDHDEALPLFTGIVSDARFNWSRLTLTCRGRKRRSWPVLPPTEVTAATFPSSTPETRGLRLPLIYGKWTHYTAAASPELQTGTHNGLPLVYLGAHSGGVIADHKMDTIAHPSDYGFAMVGDKANDPSFNPSDHFTCNFVRYDRQSDGFTMIADFLIGSDNKTLEFDEGGGDLTATLTEGEYSGETLAEEIDTQLDAAGGWAYGCSYSRTTFKFTITCVGGNPTLHWNTDATTQELAKTLGYSTAADDAGAASYEADEARRNYWIDEAPARADMPAGLRGIAVVRPRKIGKSYRYRPEANQVLESQADKAFDFSTTTSATLTANSRMWFGFSDLSDRLGVIPSAINATDLVLGIELGAVTDGGNGVLTVTAEMSDGTDYSDSWTSPGANSYIFWAVSGEGAYAIATWADLSGSEWKLSTDANLAVEVQHIWLYYKGLTMAGGYTTPEVFASWEADVRAVENMNDKFEAFGHGRILQIPARPVEYLTLKHDLPILGLFDGFEDDGTLTAGPGSGSLIRKPVAVAESLLRNWMGFNAGDLDTASLTSAQSDLDTAGIDEAHLFLQKPIDGAALLVNFAKEYGFRVCDDEEGKLSFSYFDSSDTAAMAFTASNIFKMKEIYPTPLSQLFTGVHVRQAYDYARNQHRSDVLVKATKKDSQTNTAEAIDNSTDPVTIDVVDYTKLCKAYGTGAVVANTTDLSKSGEHFVSKGVRAGDVVYLEDNDENTTVSSTTDDENIVLADARTNDADATYAIFAPNILIDQELFTLTEVDTGNSFTGSRTAHNTTIAAHDSGERIYIAEGWSDNGAGTRDESGAGNREEDAMEALARYGVENTLELSAPWLRNDTTAAAIRDAYFDYGYQRKWMVRFLAGLAAVHLEPDKDLITITHDLLPTAISGGKFEVKEVNILPPNKVEILARQV